MSTISKTHLHSMSNRRSILLGGGAALVAGLSAGSATAMSQSAAEALIKNVVGDVIRIVGTGKSRDAVLKDFEQIFSRYADVPRIAGTLLGPPWRGASAADRNAYVGALSAYLARKYGSQFEKARGTKIEITGSTDYGRKGIIVGTLVSTNVYAPYPVEWHVIETKAGPKFFDLYVEGIKLVATEKSEIRALYDRNGRSLIGLAKALDTR